VTMTIEDDVAQVPMEPMARSIGLPLTTHVRILHPLVSADSEPERLGDFGHRSESRFSVGQLSNFSGVLPVAQERISVCLTSATQSIDEVQSIQSNATPLAECRTPTGTTTGGRRSSVTVLKVDSMGSHHSRGSRLSRNSIATRGSLATRAPKRTGACRREALSPAGTVRMLWDSLAATIVAFDVWAKALEAAYLEGDAAEAFAWLHVMVSSFFVVDIALNFFTGYAFNYLIEKNLRKSAIRYARTWFLPDVVAIIPFGPLTLLRVLKLFFQHYQWQQQLYLHVVIRKNHWIRGAIKSGINKVGENTFLKLSVLVLVSTHLLSCLKQPLLPAARGRYSDLQEGIDEYLANFAAVLGSLVLGGTFQAHLSEEVPYWMQDPEHKHSAMVLSIALSLLRLLLLGVLMLWASYKAARLRTLYGDINRTKADMVRYLRRRGVKNSTLVQVVTCIEQTQKLCKSERQFAELAQMNLPEETVRAVTAEIWASPLLSIGPILHATYWHEDVAVELALRAREEVVPARTVLFKKNTLCFAAYYIMHGSFKAIDRTSRHLPAFISGEWLGEQALIDQSLRRTMTVVSEEASTVMPVNGSDFHEVLDRFGLLAKYQEFCSRCCLHGLCGRCGSVGEHFTAGCTKRSVPMLSEGSWNHAINHFFAPSLNKHMHMDIDNIGKKQTEAMMKALTSSIHRPNEHLIFLSHYKREAGTEAALIGEEVERLLPEDHRGYKKLFAQPVFLDSELLSDLSQLQEHVRLSHNLVVLLSPGCLRRPWVLVEIATAVKAGLHLIPVTLQKPTDTTPFQFPDEAYYRSLRDGSLLGYAGLEVLHSCGISALQVEGALRTFSLCIALSYSPHRNRRVRKVEIQALLRTCALKSQDVVNEDSDNSDNEEGEADLGGIHHV